LPGTTKSILLSCREERLHYSNANSYGDANANSNSDSTTTDTYANCNNDTYA
jgi:hypothetical protein